MQSLVHKNHQIGMNIMLKNFSPSALGINGRQSELIELALTYGFASMDIDMHEMLRRAQRTTTQDAAKYLEAAKIDIGGFDLGVDLDADEDAFTSQVGGLHPIAELAKDLGAPRGYLRVPAATDRLPYHEYYEIQRGRLGQINEVLEPRGIQLCIGFSAGKELEEGKEFPFVRNVEGFVAMVKSVASPNAGFMIDTWDWVVGDGTMDQLSELTAAEIVAVRLGSVTKEVEPGNVTSCDRLLPEQDGLLNHVDLIKHLASIQFTGPISPSASSTSYKGQTRESIVKRAHEAVDAISVEAGLEVATLPKDLIEDIPYEPNPIN
jgi:sugar phosphate isomerase/epimerase